MMQILHILCASLSHAQKVLGAALGAGFRESGAVSLGASKTGESNPMVAVRSTGYSLDSIIGYQDAQGRNTALVDDAYLRTLTRIANDRFKINVERIDRFRSALTSTSETQWEDAESRKRRKKEEGLARQQAVHAQRSQIAASGSQLDSTNTNLQY